MSNDSAGAWLGPGPSLKLPPSIREQAERNGRPLESEEITSLFGDDPVLSDPRRREVLPKSNMDLFLAPVLCARVHAGGPAPASDTLRSIVGDFLADKGSAAYLAVLTDAWQGRPFHPSRSLDAGIAEFLRDVHAAVALVSGAARDGISHVYGLSGRPFEHALRGREIERVGLKAGDPRPFRSRLSEDGFVRLARGFADLESFRSLLDFTEAASTLDALRDRVVRRDLAQVLRRVAGVGSRPRKEIGLGDLFEAVYRRFLSGGLALPDCHPVLQFLGWYGLHEPDLARERISRLAEELAIDDLPLMAAVRWNPAQAAAAPVGRRPASKLVDTVPEPSGERGWGAVLRDIAGLVSRIPLDPVPVDDGPARLAEMRVLIDEAEAAHALFLRSRPVAVRDHLAVLRTSVAQATLRSGEQEEILVVPSEGFVLPSDLDEFVQACADVADGIVALQSDHDEETRQHAHLVGATLARKSSVVKLIIEAIERQTSTVGAIRERVRHALELLVPPSSEGDGALVLADPVSSDEEEVGDRPVPDQAARDALLMDLVAEKGLDGITPDQIEGASDALASFVRLLSGDAFRRLLRDDFDPATPEAEDDLSEIMATVQRAGPEADPHLWVLLSHALLRKAGSGSANVDRILDLAPRSAAFDGLRKAIRASVHPQALPDPRISPSDASGLRRNEETIGLGLVEIRRLDARGADAVRTAILRDDGLLPRIERSVTARRIEDDLLRRATDAQKPHGVGSYLNELGVSLDEMGDHARFRLSDMVLRVCSGYVRWAEGMRAAKQKDGDADRGAREGLRAAFDREIDEIDGLRKQGTSYEKVVLGRAHGIAIAHRGRLAPRGAIPSFLMADL